MYIYIKNLSQLQWKTCKELFTHFKLVLSI
jgi:hypothetical protein